MKRYVTFCKCREYQINNDDGAHYSEFERNRKQRPIHLKRKCLHFQHANVEVQNAANDVRDGFGGEQDHGFLRYGLRMSEDPDLADAAEHIVP